MSNINIGPGDYSYNVNLPMYSPGSLSYNAVNLSPDVKLPGAPEPMEGSGDQSGGSGLSGDIFAGGLMVSGVLLADDATVIGAVDDVAIPFVLAGAAIGAGAVWLYENTDNPFPKPHYAERGEEFFEYYQYRKGDTGNRFPSGGQGDPKGWLIYMGGAASFIEGYYKNAHPTPYTPIAPSLQYLVPQDATYVAPRYYIGPSK